MGVDMDILEHCKKVRADHGPPYTCPVDKCGKSYKTVCGLQYHLKSYNHDNPTPPTPTVSTPKNKKGRNRTKLSKTPSITVPAPEPLTFEEAQKMVQFEINGVVCRWNINEPLEVISQNESDLKGEVKEEVKDEPKPEASATPSLTTALVPPNTTESKVIIPLPEASYKELDNYNICDAPARPNAYIRFIEKSTEELDAEVEYDVDEEDTAWLAIMNEKREEQGIAPVGVDSLELLMDRLEKESYFQAAVNGHSSGAVVDDDAVCCICMDGECQNTNVILFCDMCNLAVHQDCYGVPYIPEGQWLCRRCLQSPSRAVDCVLCPNQGGAFKQTDKGTWAHVVCALWIPEVRFANTVFLEPIDSIETIPPARWRLSCYVCKQKGVGACIQCHRSSCYSAFHVTCAQQAGLYMRMDAVQKQGAEVAGAPVMVQKIAYCDAHAPAEAKKEGDIKKEDAKKNLIQARKVLAKKRTSAPVILIPTIPPERIQEIASLVTIAKKSQFIQRLIAYWTLKRQFRNGVPLLRRLQSAQGGTRDSNTGNVDIRELCKQLKYWQCLRQDLERARLLCELVRKREKMKLEYTRVCEKLVQVKLKPLQASLGKVLDQIEAKDTNEIFLEPVDLEEVPDYITVVTHPMDLSTMRQKLKDSLYPDLDTLEKDFDLMIANCLAYNDKDTVFYKAGIKMRDQCGIIFRHAKKELEQAGLLNSDKEGAHTGTRFGAIQEESLASDIDKELESLQGKSGPDIVTKLEELLIKSQALKHGLARAKRVKLVRSELNKAKKNLSAPQSEETTDLTDQTDLTSQSDGDVDIGIVATEKEIADIIGVSPSGINRRTAVLFSKKTQLALKKDDKTETDTPPSTPTRPKRKSKGRRSPRELLSSTRSGNTGKKQASDVPDSFRVYRGRQTSDEDRTENSDDSLSTCYSHEPSEIETEDDDDEDDSEVVASEAVDEKNLQVLQLVWAKCRGYPWYPALIIDPKIEKESLKSKCSVKETITLKKPRGPDMAELLFILSWVENKQENTKGEIAINKNKGLYIRLGGPVAPETGERPTFEPGEEPAIAEAEKKGFVHKGVPLPIPPQDVLDLGAKSTEHVFLVLFFDAKRTWQWLPAEKLEIMGNDPEKDELKANEPRKQSDRKAVKKAYENALSYMAQIEAYDAEESEDTPFEETSKQEREKKSKDDN